MAAQYCSAVLQKGERNVDGDKNSPQRLSMLANNYASLNCCPSTYSTDRGCVCLTKKQTDFLSRRGYNNVTNNVA